MRRILPAALLLAGCAGVLPAQSVQSMRAQIRGGGGDEGKCTIEVDVDGAADVEVRGDMGWIRTLQGQPSRWVRFECNSPLPRNPGDFEFKGVDGRGNVQLLRDPNSTGGAAVVRIEDRQGGREGYTFDLKWRGGTYNSSDPYYRNDPYRTNDPYYRGGGGVYNDRSDPLYRGPNNRRGNVYSDGDSVAMCESAVRDRALRDYGVRNPRFRAVDVNDARGNRDRVVGSFDAPRGERYDYTCTVNTANGRIRNVDIRRR
jgi:hypothetical protein